MAKVLVVDDCSIMRELLGLQLANAGHTVDMAADGISGFHAVLRDRPDVIISDVDMPVRDGFQFVAALRAHSTVGDIPVIFLSSQARRERRAMELGAVAFVAKPVRGDTLLSLVAASLRRKLSVVTDSSARPPH